MLFYFLTNAHEISKLLIIIYVVRNLGKSYNLQILFIKNVIVIIIINLKIVDN